MTLRASRFQRAVFLAGVLAFALDAAGFAFGFAAIVASSFGIARARVAAGFAFAFVAAFVFVAAIVCPPGFRDSGPRRSHYNEVRVAKRIPSILRRPATRPRAEARAIAGEEFLWRIGPTASGIHVTPHTALTLTAYYAAINVLATDTACLPLRVYRRRADGGRDEARDDPRWELLTVTPDGVSPAIRWRQAWMGHTLGHGNGMAEIVRKGNGKPSSLNLLDPSTTQVCREPDGLRYDVGDGRKLLPQNVLHLAGFGFDGLCGYSAAHQARRAVGLGIAAEVFGEAYFGNGARPAGALKTPQKLGEAAIKHLRETWSDEQGGLGNAHRPAILEQGLEWQPFTVPPEEAQFLQTRQFQVVEIARWFRLPPHKLGDYSQSHLSNIEASNLDYLTTSLMPWLEAIEQELNWKLFTPAERKAGLYVEHNMNALLRGDMKQRGAFYKELVGLGVMTPNDVAARENMNPILPDDGGDRRFISVQLAPIDEAYLNTKQPEPPTPDVDPEIDPETGDPEDDGADPEGANDAPK